MIREKFVRAAMLYNLFFTHAMLDIVCILPAHINIANKLDVYVELQRQFVVWRNLFEDVLSVYIPQTVDINWIYTEYTEDCARLMSKLMSRPLEEYYIDFTVVKTPVDCVGKLDNVYLTLKEVSRRASNMVDKTLAIIKVLLGEKQRWEGFCSLPLSILEFYISECELFANTLKKLNNSSNHMFFLPNDCLIEHVNYIEHSIDYKYDFDNYAEIIKKTQHALKNEKNIESYCKLLSIIGNAVVKKKLCTSITPIGIDHLARYAYATKIVDLKNV